MSVVVVGISKFEHEGNSEHEYRTGDSIEVLDGDLYVYAAGAVIGIHREWYSAKVSV